MATKRKEKYTAPDYLSNHDSLPDAACELLRDHRNDFTDPEAEQRCNELILKLASQFQARHNRLDTTETSRYAHRQSISGSVERCQTSGQRRKLKGGDSE